MRVCTLITSQTITWLKTKQGGPLVSHLSSGVKWPPNALEAQTAPYSIIFTELTTQPPPDPQIHHSTAKHEPMNRREKVLESETWGKSQELKGKPQTWFAGGCRARGGIYDPTMSCWNSMGGGGVTRVTGPPHEILAAPSTPPGHVHITLPLLHSIARSFRGARTYRWKVHRRRIHPYRCGEVVVCAGVWYFLVVHPFGGHPWSWK